LDAEIECCKYGLKLWSIDSAEELACFAEMNAGAWKSSYIFFTKLMTKIQRSGNRRLVVIGLQQVVKALAAWESGVGARPTPCSNQTSHPGRMESQAALTTNSALKLNRTLIQRK
jgi:hypothetical protein